MNIRKARVFFLCSCVVAIICGCNKREVSQILAYHDNEFSFYSSQVGYFLPEDIYYNYINALRGINPNVEIGKEALTFLSVKNIRPKIREVCSMDLQSNLMIIYIEFPNRKVYNKYLEKYNVNPFVSKKDLSKLLKYEYSFALSTGSFAWNSDYYINFYENSVYKGKLYYRLSEEDVKYFLSDDFVKNMDVISGWVKGKKWNDLNSTLGYNEGHYYIYIFNPATDLPVINDIKKVALVKPTANTYMTKTGNYTFTNPYNTRIETFENEDGSFDILYPNDKDVVQGIRIYLSGATTEIDRFRRVVPK